MEALSYVNIFETKGLEYLLVIAFMVGLVLFLRVLRPSPELAADASTAAPDEHSAAVVACPAGARCPFLASRDFETDESEAEEEAGAA